MSSLYPGSWQYAPMLISKAPKDVEKKIRTNDYLAQTKKDGFLYQLEKTDDGKVYLFSRNKSKITGELTEKIAQVPHIEEWAEENVPNGTILIGEIYYPGEKSNSVSTIMGSLPEKAIARQKQKGKIHYYIHDMIRYAGNDYLDKGFQERYEVLKEHVHDCENWLEIAENFENSESMYNIEDTIQSLLANGEEGAVIKLKSGLYMPSKRPVYNFKIKEEQNDIDLIITALMDPVKEYTGKELGSWEYFDDKGYPVTKAYYYGWKNAIQVSGYKNGKLTIVGTVASGITDEMKKDMSEHPENYIGRVCELQAMSWTADGALRHPRFIRMRPDKPASDCIL